MMELAEAPQVENALPPPKELKKESGEEDIFEEEALLTEENEDSDYLKNDVTDPRTLFIKNLPSSVKQDELKKVFDQATDIEIPVDNEGSTKGEFGYVELASEEDLKKDLELNDKKLRGQPLILDRASDKENVQEIQERCARTLFIKNLPHSTKQDDLKEIFQEAIDIRLPFGKNGLARGIAYIEFATEAIADKVFEEAQGSDVKGNSIVIDYMGKKSTTLPDINTTSRLLINNLSFSVTEDSLRGMFEKAVAVNIPYKNDRPQGYAFVEFECVEDAKEAMKTWNFKDLDGRMVRLTYMTKKKEDKKRDSEKRKMNTKDKETSPAKKAKSDEEFILLVGKLNWTKDVHEIKSAISHFFSNEGLKIQKVCLCTNKRFGYVNFASENELQKALELDGKNVMGQPVKLDRASKEDMVGNKAMELETTDPIIPRSFTASSSYAANLANKILVVSNLSYSVTVNTLRPMFEKAVAIRIPQKYGRLRGFAFVQFESVEDAKEALENCNNMEIEGRIVHIEISKSKEERVGGGMGNFAAVQSSKTLLVNNLSLSATKDSLLCVFEKAVGIRISRKKGKSIGFGFVEFESVENAEEALKTCNNAVIEGRNIRLEFCQSREDKEARIGNSAAFSSSKAVKKVPFSSTKDSTQSVLEKSVSVKIPLNIGNQKGCAFMEFTSVEDAIEALKTVNKAEIEARSVTQCHTVFSQSKKMEGERWSYRPLKTLFVRGLSDDTNDETLKNAFDGAVNAKIITDRETGSSKGFGYVNFDTEEDCKAARETMDDCEINGKKVSVDYAQPKCEGGRGRGGSFGRGRGGFVDRGRGRGGFDGRGRGGFDGRGRGRGGFDGRGRRRGGFDGRGRGGFDGRGGRRGGSDGRDGGRGGFGGRGGERGGGFRGRSRGRRGGRQGSGN
ncbi:nucleolin-like isoform X2 [Triplophysa dalaica]|uniref:nucleolin-like isoform X2 n=1 Tax=Triplophysa dalaica TaxID=1582913 RepID=UPI0024E0412E|nr:nucleolin-like isoform X2 [Triplophysa dalaica]